MEPEEVPPALSAPPNLPSFPAGLPSRYWKVTLGVAGDAGGRLRAATLLRSLHDRTHTKTNVRGEAVAAYKVVSWVRKGDVIYVAFRQAAGYTLSALKKNVVSECDSLSMGTWHLVSEKEVSDAVKEGGDEGQPGEQGKKRKKPGGRADEMDDSDDHGAGAGAAGESSAAGASASGSSAQGASGSGKASAEPAI